MNLLPPAWWIYVLRCRDGSLYCGITNDLSRRLSQHQKGTASRYTRARLPVELLKHWEVESHPVALRGEAAFKRLPRHLKLQFLHSDFPPIPFPPSVSRS